MESMGKIEKDAEAGRWVRGKIIGIDETHGESSLDDKAGKSVEETYGGLLEKEANILYDVCDVEQDKQRTDCCESRGRHDHPDLYSKTGGLDLKAPIMRSLRNENQIIEHHQRGESSAEETVMEIYLAEVSVRRMENISEVLWGVRVESSVLSELNQKIYQRIDEWLKRPIKGSFAYLSH